MKKIFFQRFVLGIFIVLPFVTYYFLNQSRLFSFLVNNKRINILIVGCDELKYSKHADVIMILSYSPITRFLDVISLPRDTIVTRKVLRKALPNLYIKKKRKINEIYAYVFKRKKDEHKACETLKTLISSMLNFPIEFYLQIDYKGFKNLVNTIRGIKVKIDRRMDYDDNWGNLHIHFKPGIYTLNGQSALEYIRYRDKIYGDQDRIDRQQKLLYLILKKLSNPSVVIKLFDVVEIMKNNIFSNLNLTDIFVLSNELRNLRKKKIRFQTLPGESEYIKGIYYWKLDEKQVEDIIDVISKSDKMYESLEKVVRIKFVPPIKIEIWNASNYKKAAYKLQLALREYGLDTVRWGNYGVLKHYTMVIDRTGDYQTAYKVASLIGCRNVKTKIDQSKLVNLSIVIGKDFPYTKWLKEK